MPAANGWAEQSGAGLLGFQGLRPGGEGKGDLPCQESVEQRGEHRNKTAELIP